MNPTRKWKTHFQNALWGVFVAVPAAAGMSSSNDGGSDFPDWAKYTASVGIVAGGCVFVIICTWAWWRRQFRKLCPVPPPPDDDPPVAQFEDPYAASPFPRTSYGSTGSIRQLDAAALPSDQEDFYIEPLPTLEALAAATTRYYVNENGDARLSFESLQPGPIIIPPEDDPDIFAHDWFTNAELQFPRNDISFIQEIGTGWFGMVIESEAKDIVPFPRRCKVLVKFLREEASDREQMRFLDEARVYRDSNHKNILKLLGHCLETTPYLLILEHYPKGDLKSYLKRHAEAAITTLDGSGAATRRKMALDIAHGLHWMHDNGFVHPDLAARNCLVGNEGQIVIGDYGLATQLHKEDYYWSSGSSLPIRWTAPDSVECTTSYVKTLKKTKDANMWSYGVVVWEICELGKTPYIELTDDQVITRVLMDKNYSLRPPSITNLPYVALRDELAKIISDCCYPLPSKRPTIADIVNILDIDGDRASPTPTLV